jgi:hypothetical protein
MSISDRKRGAAQEIIRGGGSPAACFGQERSISERPPRLLVELSLAKGLAVSHGRARETDRGVVERTALYTW